MSNIATTNSEVIAIFGDPNMGDQFISFNPETPAEKVKLFNAINSPDKRLADVINAALIPVEVS